MLYALIKNLLPQLTNDQLTASQTNRWNSTKVSDLNDSSLSAWSLASVVEQRHCFTFGRFVMHRKSRIVAVLLLAGYQVLWRFFFTYLGPPYPTSIIEFVLQSEESIGPSLSVFRVRQSMRLAELE